MKLNRKLKLIFSLIFISLFSFYSCNFFTENQVKEHESENIQTKENSTTEDQTVSDSAAKLLTLCVSPSFVDSIPASSRSAYPDFTSINLNNYTFTAESSEFNATGTYGSGKITYIIHSLTFTEEKVVNFYINDTNGKKLWAGSTSITYTTLGQTKELNIYFQSYNDSEVIGNIDLRIETSSGYTVSCEITDSEDQPVSDITATASSNECTITTPSGVKGGTYKAIIKIYNATNSGDIREYIIQTINVWPGLTTNLWYLSSGTPAQTYEIPVSQDIVKYYVKGTNPTGLYGSGGLTGVANAADTNSGSIMHPLATINAAIAKCADGTTKYVIICDGKLAGFSIGSISNSTYKNCNITIRGGGNSENYSQISSKVQIMTSKPVTLENIKISGLTQTAIDYNTDNNTVGFLHLNNCEITNNKMQGNVGGIRVNSGNVYIKGKIIITGNKWRANASDTVGDSKNLVLYSGTSLVVEGPLDSDSRIGVSSGIYDFCTGFKDNSPGIDALTVFSADFESNLIKVNNITGEPCLADAPLYAMVGGKNYYTLSSTINAIVNAKTGYEATVKLCSPVTAQDLGNSATDGTIVRALYELSQKSNDNQGKITLELDTDAGVEIELSDEYNSEMFKDCSCLKTINVQGLITEDLSSMKYMFANCSGIVNLDLTGFSGDSVTDMEGMFSGCTSLKEIDACFSTQNTTNMKELFMSCEALEDYYFDFSSQNVTDMSNMFANCISLKSVDFTFLYTSSVENYSEMFASCSALEAIYVWPGRFVMNEGTITSTNMFAGCNSLTGARGTTISGNPIDKTYARIDGGTSAPGYFTDCRYASIDKGDGSGLISHGYLPSLVNELTGTYCNGKDITLTIYPRSTTADLGKASTQDTIAWAIKNTTANSIKLVIPAETYLKLNANSSGLFEGCEKIISADLSGFDTSDVSNMQAMFRDCSSLKTLDLSSFDTTSVQNTATMFYNDNVLTTVYVSNTFNTSSISDDTSMFTNCTSIKGGNGTTYSDAFDDKTYARIDSNSTPGYFTSVMDKPLDVTEDNITEAFTNLHSGTNVVRINGSLNTNYIKALRTAIEGTSYNIALDFTNITNTSYTLSSANGTSGGNTKGDSFKGYGNIIKIIISGNHKITFGKEAFAGCTNLECIKFVDSFNNQNDTITDGYAPFANCNKLFTIDFTECTNVVFNAQIFINNENLSPYQNTVTQNVLFGSKLSSLIIKDTSYFHDTNFKFKYSGNSTRWPQLIQNRLGTQRENLKCYCVEDGKTLTMDSTGIWG